MATTRASKAHSYLFVFLNVVRVLSIISLLLLFSSSILSMVEDIKAVNAFIADGKTFPTSDNSTEPIDEDYIQDSTVPNQPAGAFWAVLNWLLIIFQAIVLVLSECSFPIIDRFFTSFFPILSPSFGLGALGVIQCLLGAAVLSHRVNEFTLVSSFLLFSVGCLHVFLGLIFREKAKVHRSVSGWREAKRDPLPKVEEGRSIRALSGMPFAAPPGLFSGSGTAYGYGDEKGALGAARSGSLSSQKSGLGFGRQASKFAANQGYVVREPEEAVPPYAPKPAVHFAGSARSHVSVSSASSYSESRSGHEYEREGFSPVEEVDEEDEELRAHSMVRTDSSATAVERR